MNYSIKKSLAALMVAAFAVSSAVMAGEVPSAAQNSMNNAAPAAVAVPAPAIPPAPAAAPVSASASGVDALMTSSAKESEAPVASVKKHKKKKKKSKKSKAGKKGKKTKKASHKKKKSKKRHHTPAATAVDDGVSSAPMGQ